MLVIKMIAVFIMGMAVGMLYRIPRSLLFYGSVNGTAAWLTMYALIQGGANIVSACFFGSVVAGALAELLARILKKPATIFIVPGFIPLVPGREAFTTMRHLVEGQYNQAISMGTQTMLMGGAIAFGIFLSTTAYRLALSYSVKSEIKNAGNN